ncbi:hypothetical protein [Parasphingorhabdus halotolerans]|uniref:Uncharacterized protein n=1 Tax=Parasphingorhabdus halotolerans TaxID=2725558 RepID=A0A6H2DMM7_9SPHN|nr:hypothetical protein [Parasphingorhabdus halotolerans]QJB68916.1 hypothetical protein HF685_06195 [Parasphingorhabdus halotolerans]
MTSSTDGAGIISLGSHAPAMKVAERCRVSLASSWRVSVLLALMLAMFSAPATAAQGERKRGAVTTAGDAVTQPLEDLGLKHRDIPYELALIQEEPYSLNGMDGCDAVRTEIAKLEDVLGPDADAPEEKNGMVNKALKTGGSVLGGFIPFRGVVREVSGANKKRSQLQRAIYAGVARRGYLKGYARGLQCQSSEELAIDAARAHLERIEAER